MKKILIFTLILFLSFVTSNLFSQEKDKDGNINIKGLSQEDMIRIFGDIYSPRILMKGTGEQKEKNLIVSGNKIKTILYNTGSICRPNIFSPPGNVADLVWQGLGYGFEFGPLGCWPSCYTQQFRRF